MKSISFLFIASWILSLGCQVDRQTDEYKFAETNPLQLSRDSHPHGFLRSQCFACHLPTNIHQVDRLKDPSFAMASFLVEQNGLRSCSGCHGDNGVQQ